jgi:hypothetical protein
MNDCSSDDCHMAFNTPLCDFAPSQWRLAQDHGSFVSVVTKFRGTKFRFYFVIISRNFAKFREIFHNSYEMSCRKIFLTTLHSVLCGIGHRCFI